MMNCPFGAFDVGVRSVNRVSGAPLSALRFPAELTYIPDMFRRVLPASLLIAMALAPTLLRAQESAPPALESDDEHGNFLVIPGLGKIPLPPGTRAFGPGAAPRSLAPQQHGPQAVAPPAPRTPDQQRADEMTRLFARLAQAEDEQEAQSVATAIRKRWARSGSDTVDLLAARAEAASAGGVAPLARALLDYVVALSPHWTEGLVRRARLRDEQGDLAGAQGDLEQAARIDPRRFDALAALGTLAEKAGDKKRALDAYRKALAISPREDNLRKSEERLRLEVEGRDI